MNCFYPPRELEKRHPGLAALKKQALEEEAEGEHMNSDKQAVYVVRMFLCFASFYELGSCAICLRMFSKHLRPMKSIMIIGSPISRSW